jgi:hypothetical protein
MQAAQHPFGRLRMVILDEYRIDAGQFGETARIVAFKEKAARIPEHGRVQHNHIGNRGGRRFHQNTLSCKTCSKYWP